MYYVFRESFLRDGNHSSPAPSDWYSPGPLSAPFELSVVFNKPITTLKQIIGVGKYTIMRKELTQALRDLGESHIETYRFIAKDSKGGIDDSNFCVVRFYDPVRCIDPDKSDYEADEEGYVSRVSRLEIREASIPIDRHFFYADFVDPGIIAPPIQLCSQAAREMFVRHNAKGAEFLIVSRYGL